MSHTLGYESAGMVKGGKKGFRVWFRSKVGFPKGLGLGLDFQAA
jgi:hypothetical protein